MTVKLNYIFIPMIATFNNRSEGGGGSQDEKIVQQFLIADRGIGHFCFEFEVVRCARFSLPPCSWNLYR